MVFHSKDGCSGHERPKCMGVDCALNCWLLAASLVSIMLTASWRAKELEKVLDRQYLLKSKELLFDACINERLPSTFILSLALYKSISYTCSLRITSASHCKLLLLCLLSCIFPPTFQEAIVASLHNGPPSSSRSSSDTTMSLSTTIAVFSSCALYLHGVSGAGAQQGVEHVHARYDAGANMCEKKSWTASERWSQVIWWCGCGECESLLEVEGR